MDPALLITIALVVLAVAIGVVVFVRRPRRPLPEAQGDSDAVADPASLAVRLEKTRQALGGRLKSVFSRGTTDKDFWAGLEEALIAADVGVRATAGVVDRVRERRPVDATEARLALHDELLAILDGKDRDLRLKGSPSVIVVVGVNGVGKTTSIAKLAAQIEASGSTALLGAADTFRAAADAQLKTWADRVGVEVVSGQAGADPAAVAFDAFQAAKARQRDVVIVDTAGRLHSKHNLMQELGKIVRVLEREAGSIGEVLLVLDATTGQNGLAQIKQFTDVVGVTGIVLTKLDGTAKGGIVVAMEQDYGVPVKFIGVGEGVQDLIPFEPGTFIDALLADV
ncbi:MAG: signal recognition particle-docking protein FtsY [Acidimicrobiia bacterium]|nr:signal recognition particle-docking protein FtsY [Acidimicrobiia bacterium]